MVKENDFIYAKGESKTPIPYSLPEGLQDGEGLFASRPNEIEISNKEGGGYPAVIEKRLYMTFCIEYQVRIGSQVIRVHTSHSNVFKEGSRCFLTFKNPRWYEKESEALEKERTERQVI